MDKTLPALPVQTEIERFKLEFSLQASYDNKELQATEKEIKNKDSDALFQRPVMTAVVISLVSPWLDEQQIIKPRDGAPLNDIPIGVILTKKASLEMNKIATHLMLSCTVNFRDMNSQLDFFISISINGTDFEVVEIK